MNRHLEKSLLTDSLQEDSNCLEKAVVSVTNLERMMGNQNKMLKKKTYSKSNKNRSMNKKSSNKIRSLTK